MDAIFIRTFTKYAEMVHNQKQKDRKRLKEVQWKRFEWTESIKLISNMFISKILTNKINKKNNEHTNKPFQ